MGGHNILLGAFVFLMAAVTIVPLAQRSGLGTVLGYLVAGIVIGPFGFGLVSDAKSVMHFAEFGVVMMLFLIGLELNPNTLWRLRRPIVGVGGLQVLVTIIILFGLFDFAGYAWKTALVMAMGLSLSSTAVVMQLIAARNQMQTRMGQATFSVLLFQDIAVIPILAIIPLLATLPGNSLGEVVGQALNGSTFSLSSLTRDWPIWTSALKTFALVGAIILVGHYGLRHVFYYIARTQVEELFTATVLLIVVAVTLLMEKAGLSAALGAFIAGVVLAESEYRHEIERELKPFKSLLLGLFFMSVGMSINFDVVQSHPWIVLALLIGLLAAKFLICVGIGYFARLRIHQILPFALLLAQGGEFAFVIFSYARQMHVISSDIVSLMTAIAALSMAVTPLLLSIYDGMIRSYLHFHPEATVEGPSRTENEAPVPRLDGAIIIAGCGRFGQVIGRLLNAAGFVTTILDPDPDQIDAARKMGSHVFYGDISDLSVLKNAGLANARLLIMAANNREQTNKTVALVKKNYPNLPILARAIDRRHAFELSQAGADYFVREMFYSATHLGEVALKKLGVRAYAAREITHKFARHDEQTLHDSFKVFDNEKDLISFNLKARKDMMHLFDDDRG